MKKCICILSMIFILLICQFTIYQPINVYASSWFDDLDGDGMPDNFSDAQKQAYQDILNGKIYPSTALQLANPDFWIKTGVSKVLDFTNKEFNSLINIYKNYESGYYNKYGNLPLTSCLYSQNIASCTRDYEIWKNTINKPIIDSGSRNYYTGTDDNTNYNKGRTSSHNIVNYDNQTITYYDHSTNQYITNNYNNYYYDITNYSFNYDYDFNTSYTIINNINNTELRINDLDNTIINKYYFELPDGNNSYNMTEETIKGYNLDFNIKNYNSISDNSDLLALFHFDNDILSDSINQDYYFEIIPSSINFKDSNSKFNEYLVFNKDFSITIDTNNLASFDFRFYANVNNYSRIFFNDEPPSSERFSHDLYRVHKNVINDVSYVSKETIIPDSMILQSSGTIYPSCPYGYEEVHYWSDDNNLFVKCDGYRTVTEQVPIVNNYVEYSSDSSNDERYKRFIFDGWNHVAFNYFPNHFYGKDMLTLFVNGVKYTNIFLYPLPDNKLRINFITDGLFGIDEFKISSNSFGNSNYIVPNSPYDTDIAYILPITDTHNTILIKSLINVNSIQFGGKRNSNAVLGDVYVSINNADKVDSVQQFNGSDWIYVDSAIYNEYLSKWVSFVGYSIFDDSTQLNPDMTYTPIDNEGVIVDTDFFEYWFNEIISAISNINFVNHFESGTNFWDFLISFKDSLFSGIRNMFGTITDFIKYLIIPSDDYLNDFDFTPYKEKLGILTFPFDITSGILENFSNLESTDFKLISDPVTVSNVVLIPAVDFNFNNYINDSNLNNIYQYYLILSDGILFFGIFNLIRRKVLNLLGDSNDY